MGITSTASSEGAVRCRSRPRTSGRSLSGTQIAGDCTGGLPAHGGRRPRLGLLHSVRFSRCVGVGTALEVEWEPSFGRHAVNIRWDADLTKRMRAEPINYADYRQQVQYPAVRAKDTTRKVLGKWLATHHDSLRPVGAKRSTSPRARFFNGSASETPQRHAEGVQLHLRVHRLPGTACPPSGTHRAGIGTGRHDVANSLLLRADIHARPLDLGRVFVKADLTLAVDPSVPRSDIHRASREALVSRPTGVTKSAFAKQLAKHRSLWTTI